MKKIAILLAFVLALSCCLFTLAACGDGEEASSPADSAEATSSADTSSAAASSEKEETSAAVSSEEAESSAPEESSEEVESSAPEESSEPETNPDATENPDHKNLAAGKSYVTSLLYRQGGADAGWGYSETVDITYPDTDGVELTDGVFPAADAAYTDDPFMGFSRGGESLTTPDYRENGYSYVTVNLGEVYVLSQLVLYVGTSKLDYGISVPATVEFLVSDDGENFTSVGTVVPTDDTETSFTAVTLDCNATGQYVQVRFTSSGWMFLCEFEAY